MLNCLSSKLMVLIVISFHEFKVSYHIHSRQCAVVNVSSRMLIVLFHKAHVLDHLMFTIYGNLAILCMQHIAVIC